MTILGLFLLYALALSIALSRAGYRGPRTAAPARARARPSRILVVGATGGTGRQLVTQALERGYQVTALVRKVSRLGTTHERLTVVAGDVLDDASVASAVRGQEAVLSALGHRRYYYPSRILSKGTGNVLRAMEAEGVRRFICQTSLGIGDSAGRLGLYYTFFIIPLVLPFYFWDKTRQERAIASSQAEWVIVRPGLLNDKDKRGRLAHGRDVGSFLWSVRISRADAAAFMLDQLESDLYVRSAPGVAW